jgi:chromosome segregation ATPase
MSEKSPFDPVNPMAMWRSFQEANVEVWAQGMASLINTDAYSTAMRDFLDGYLATSAPFRKILDQYMNFWLANLNMPSREELSRLDQRLMTSEMRLNGLYHQLDQVLTSIQRQTSSVMTLSNDHQAAIAQLESHTQSLATQLEQIPEAIKQSAAKYDSILSQQPERSSFEDYVAEMKTTTERNVQDMVQVVSSLTTGLKLVTLAIEEQSSQVTALKNQQIDDHCRVDQHVQTLEKRTNEITTTMREQMTQTSQTIVHQQSSIERIEARMQSLDKITEQILHMLQDQAQQSAEPGPDQSAEMTTLEIRMQALDEKTGQVLQALETLQSTLKTAPRSHPPSTSSAIKRVSKKDSPPDIFDKN